MALLLFSLLLLLLIQTPPLSSSNLHKAKNLLSNYPQPQTPSLDLQQQPTPTPTTFFQVTQPIKLPKTKPCSSLLLQHDFGYTFQQPPVTASYTPPLDCPSQNFSKIVLEWTATCKGRQFDRIFGVWLGGVELLRSCTAEPRATGIIWTVQKDITRYSSLLKTPQTLAVYLGNLVDKTYTGVYHVNLTFHFYPAEETHDAILNLNSDTGSGFDSNADLILPISRNLPLNDGLWFLIENSTDTQLKEFTVPRNAYRAVLEVFVSFHSSDEFWYGNPPNEYITANNLTNTPGNGPFREVVISLDGQAVGAVWPFTVIYTGGVNPLLWRPITGIGSFDLPTYDVEITPFLGKILDGKSHKFGFGVTDALSVWFVDANLHIWLDHKSSTTKGHLIKYEAEPIKTSLVSKIEGLNGTFFTSACRHMSATGWVKSSHGKIITHVFQDFDFMNKMVFEKDGNLQKVRQNIRANYGVYTKFPSYDMYSKQVFRKFPLRLFTDTVDQGNGSYSLVANVSLGFDEERFSGARFGFSYSSLRNLQKGLGSMIVEGNLVTSGLGSTKQLYTYDSNEGCYYRDVSSRNYTILHDDSGETCSKRSSQSPPGSGFGRRPSFSG